MFSDSNRVKIEDKRVDGDVADVDLKNHLFVRLVAKERRFTRIDFKYSIFDTCYLRKCVFDSCDFTGCRFIGTSLYGSSFSGCKLDYSIFERTIVDDDLLDSGCPGMENLKMRFARTLRTNYQQLGDSKSANKAIRVELDAMEVYLHKGWHSNESYYRHKLHWFKSIENVDRMGRNQSLRLDMGERRKRNEAAACSRRFLRAYLSRRPVSRGWSRGWYLWCFSSHTGGLSWDHHAGKLSGLVPNGYCRRTSNRVRSLHVGYH